MKFNGRVRRLLNSGKPILSAMTRLQDPVYAEIMARSGLDCVIVDNEHYPFTDSDCVNIVRAVHGAGADCAIRMSGIDFNAIYRALDMGFDGIYIPNVETAEEAQLIVDACKYPPEGHRGCCPITRGADYGVNLNVSEYYQNINDQIFVVIMIESKRGFMNLDEILKVKGLDVIAVGPSDLSGSFGKPGTVDQEIRDVMDMIYDKARKAGVVCETMVKNAADAAEGLNKGDRFLYLDSDLQIISNAFKTHNTEALEVIRKAGFTDNGKSLKQRIRDLEPIILPYIRLPEPAVAEVAVLHGSDLIVLDNEHFAYSDSDIINMIRAVHCRGGKVLVRLPDKKKSYIGRVLDMGADGVVAPIIDSYEEALAVVRACLYGPEGERGLCPITAGADYGFGHDPKEYAKEANKRIIIAVMIESQSGVRDLPRILEIPQIDYISIGPADISASYGYAGQVDSPVVKKIIKDIQDQIKAKGKAVCAHGYTTEDVRASLSENLTILNTGSELQYLMWGLKDILSQISGQEK